MFNKKELNEKHFKEIVRILKHNGANFSLCNDMANFLQSISEIFDKITFLRSCGMLHEK